MNVLAWLLAGAAVGWISYTSFEMNVHRGRIVSAMIGAAGAYFGGQVLTPVFGSAMEDAGNFSVFALVIASVTAISCVMASDAVYERFGI